MFYLINPADHVIIFHDNSRSVVEQYQADNPTPATVVVELVDPAYTMMARREATLQQWKQGVKPLLEKLASFPDPSLLSEGAQMEYFLEFMGVDEQLATQQMHAYVREHLRAPQDRHVEAVTIDLETGLEIKPAEQDSQS